MRAGQAAQVGAAGHQDRVDVIGLVDVADCHGGDARLVADAVGERRLEHAAIHGLGLIEVWPGRHIDDVDAGARCSMRAISTASSGVMPSSPTQSLAEMRTEIGLCGRPYLAHGMENLEREAHTVLEVAAVVVGAVVGERRDEGRQQIAVRVVQLEHVEARHARPSAAGSTNCVLHARPCLRASSRAAIWLAGDQARERAPTTCQLPWRSGASISSQPSWVEPFGPEWPSWIGDFRVRLGMDEVDNALPGRFVLWRRKDPCSRA